MSYAPVALIATGPDPADSGLTLTVEADTGPRFPAVPFEAIVLPNQQRPRYGTNACKIQVTEVDYDTLTFTREDPTIEITPGLVVSVLHAEPVSNLGEAVTISETFPAADAPYTFDLVSPAGTVIADAAGVDDGSGVTHFSFTPDRPGRWTYRAAGATHVGGDRAFYVRFGVG